MQDRQLLDRYFTEQVVGAPFSVTMGPSVGVRQEPPRGLLVNALTGAAELSALAARTAWASEPADVVAGRPVSLPGLMRWRRGLLIAAFALWSILLVAALQLWGRL